MQESPQVSAKRIPDKEALGIACTTRSCTPHLLDPQFHTVFIHPTPWMNVNKTPGQNLSLGIVFRRKITIGFSLVPSARAGKHNSEPRFLIPSCFEKHCFSTTGLHGSRSRHIKPHWGFIHVSDLYQFIVIPFSRIFQILLKADDFFFSRSLGSFCATSSSDGLQDHDAS